MTGNGLAWKAASMLLALSCVGAAQAGQYALSASGVTGAGLSLRAAALDWPLLAGRAGFGVSNQAVDAQWRRNFSVLRVGAASVQVQGAYVYGASPYRAGAQAGAQASLSAGPVALNLQGYVWDTPLAATLPLSPYEQGSRLDGSGAVGQSAPLDLAPQGHWLSAQARYRLRRDLIVSAFAQQGAQSGVGAFAQWRPAPSQATSAQAQIAARYQLGAQVMRGASGVLAGAAWEAENWSLNVQALLRPQDSGMNMQWQRGLTLGGRDISFNLYAAYEPWRISALPLRYGLGLGWQAQRSQWTVRAVGGQDAAGHNSYGLSLGWQFDPDAVSEPAE